MAQTELIDSLITTYRELNNTVRQLPEEAWRRAADPVCVISFAAFATTNCAFPRH